MSPKYKVGQRIEYKPVGGPDSHTSVSTGIIERVITKTEEAGDTGVRVKASKDEPRYEIKNVRTGKAAAYKEANILRVLDEDEVATGRD